MCTDQEFAPYIFLQALLHNQPIIPNFGMGYGTRTKGTLSVSCTVYNTTVKYVRVVTTRQNPSRLARGHASIFLCRRLIHVRICSGDVLMIWLRWMMLGRLMVFWLVSAWTVQFNFQREEYNFQRGRYSFSVDKTL